MRVVIIGVLIGLFLQPSSSRAQWSSDPFTNTPVCTAAHEQSHLVTAPDGRGGAIIAWMDFRSDTVKVFAQRLDERGTPRWASNGISLCDIPGERYLPQITGDGAGGAIIAWVDDRFPDHTTIFAQRVDSGGALQWGTSGAFVGLNLHPQYPVLAMVSDGAGGALVTWNDSRAEDNANYDIYAQHLTSSGSTTRGWSPDGNAVCAFAGNQRAPTLVPDDAGGAIIAWEDFRSGGGFYAADIYAQHVSTRGQLLWQPDGLPICTASGHQFPPVMADDGGGGAIIAWADGRSCPDSACGGLYAQRVSAAGVPQWSADGIRIGQLSTPYAAMVSDGRKGAILAVTVFTSDDDSTVVLAHRIGANGELPWGPGGVHVSRFAGDHPLLVPNGRGGVNVAWSSVSLYNDGVPEYAGRGNDILAQRIDRDGELQWSSEGIAVTAARGRQEEPFAIPDGSGGLIVTWTDYRADTRNAANPDLADIYAQHVRADGSLRVTTHRGRSKGRPWLSAVPIGRQQASGITRLEFTTDEPGEAVIEVFDVQGRRVRTIMRDVLAAGAHVSEWDARDDGGIPVRSGLYFVRAIIGDAEASARVVVLR